jgi:hypothetical protein
MLFLAFFFFFVLEQLLTPTFDIILNEMRDLPSLEVLERMKALERRQEQILSTLEELNQRAERVFTNFALVRLQTKES